MLIIVVTINCYYCFIFAMSVLYECCLCWVCVVRVPGSDWCWCSDVVRPHYEATTGHYHGLGAGEDRSPATLHWSTACTPHLNISSDGSSWCQHLLKSASFHCRWHMHYKTPDGDGIGNKRLNLITQQTAIMKKRNFNL